MIFPRTVQQLVVFRDSAHDLYCTIYIILRRRKWNKAIAVVSKTIQTLRLINKINVFEFGDFLNKDIRKILNVETNAMTVGHSVVYYLKYVRDDD